MTTGLRHELAPSGQPTSLDVVALVARCARLAQSTSHCEVRFIGVDPAMTHRTHGRGSALWGAVIAPAALSRAVSAVLDNAVHAAGPGGQVTVDVNGTTTEIIILVIDDGPVLERLSTKSTLVHTLAHTHTRALVRDAGGVFEFDPGRAGGAVARIVLPAIRPGSMTA